MARRSSLRELFAAWSVIGTQSLGGGPSALHLMRRELVERRGWVSHREFLEDWALSKLSLGINQVALTAFEGIRVAGARGMAVSLVAYLVPAAFITAAMTAAYALVRDEPLVRAALAGAGPVTAGLTLGNGFLFGRSALRRGWRGAVDVAYWVSVAVLAFLFGLPPFAAIAAGLVVGVLLLRGESSRASAGPQA